VSIRPGPGERPEALPLLGYAPREGLDGTQVVLGLLTHGLGAISQPVLSEANVALLELGDPHVGDEPLLGRLGGLLLEPQELHPVPGQPDAAPLGSREVLRQRLVGFALGLGHLPDGSRHLVHLVCVRGGHRHPSMVVGACRYVHITHIRDLHSTEAPDTRFHEHPRAEKDAFPLYC
jgi:hypothetical protein